MSAINPSLVVGKIVDKSSKEEGPEPYTLENILAVCMYAYGKIVVINLKHLMKEKYIIELILALKNIMYSRPPSAALLALRAWGGGQFGAQGGRSAHSD